MILGVDWIQLGGFHPGLLCCCQGRGWSYLKGFFSPMTGNCCWLSAKTWGCWLEELYAATLCGMGFLAAWQLVSKSRHPKKTQRSDIIFYDTVLESTEHHFCHSHRPSWIQGEGTSTWPLHRSRGQLHNAEEHVGWEILLQPSWKMQSSIEGKYKEQKIRV